MTLPIVGGISCNLPVIIASRSIGKRAVGKINCVSSHSESFASRNLGHGERGH